MGDDVGWFNIGAYHQGIMSGKTPNLDKLAAEGMRFTDYYAEASCTAGRANFITGEIPLRTGLTTVGQAGADVGIPDQAVTLATVLKSLGYATGQFGKNHLGDLNKYLPTVHGFDEFFGYLYHLDAMSDPYWFDYPQDWIDKYGPRNLVHCYASDTDDPTVQPRWGKVGKQRIVDEGPLAPFPNMGADQQNWQKGRDAKYDMETFDEVLVEHSKGFMDQAKKDGKPFFIWHNTTRMHVFTYLAPKYQAMMNYNEQLQRRRGRHGAAGRQCRRLAEASRRHRRGRQHHRHLHDRQRCRGLHLAGRRHDPVPRHQGHRVRGRLPRAGIIRWPGKIKPGRVENGIFSGLDWLPTLAAAAGNPNITQQLLHGVKLGDRTYKNHLDGYNQMDLLPGKGPSARHELFYFGGPQLGAIRIDDFKFQFLPAALRLAGREGDDRHADDRQSASGSVRADAVDPRRNAQRHGRRLHERLLRPRILALRSGAADSGGAGEDRRRVSADAGAGLVQPRSRQKASRGGDQIARRAIVGTTMPRARQQARPPKICKLYGSSHLSGNGKRRAEDEQLGDWTAIFPFRE